MAASGQRDIQIPTSQPSECPLWCQRGQSVANCCLVWSGGLVTVSHIRQTTSVMFEKTKHLNCCRKWAWLNSFFFFLALTAKCMTDYIQFFVIFLIYVLCFKTILRNAWLKDETLGKVTGLKLKKCSTWTVWFLTSAKLQIVYCFIDHFTTSLLSRSLALQNQSWGTKQKGCWHSILPSNKSFIVHGPECRQILRTSEHLFNQR